MIKLIYKLVVALVIVCGPAFSNTKTTPQAKPNSATEKKAALKKWECSPDGIQYKKWQTSSAGKKVQASYTKIKNSIKTFAPMEAVVTVLFLSIKNKSVELRVKFFKLLSVLIISAIVSLTSKYSIVRSRPFENYPDIEKLSEAGNSSFPSGHTIEAFAIAFAISILFHKRKYIVPIYLWAFLIAYSRLALGVHYPIDVIAGILTGSVTSYLTLKIFDLQVWKKAAN
jgi:PAP2 superfamily